tara:strand:+ start:355 stop:1377 length:1023 start_codon:yes stop_codon:yes gene_type:complete
MSFTTEIQAYAGATTGYEASLVQWLNEAVKDIVTKSIAMDPGSIDKYTGNFQSDDANSTSFDSDGKFLINNKPVILSVFKSVRTIIVPTTLTSFEARRVDASLKHKITDTSSIYYATDTSPSYYIEDNKLTVIPATGISAQDFSEIRAVTYGEVNDGESTISNFPSENLPYIVYYTAMQVIYAKMLKFSTEYLAEGNVIDLEMTTISNNITSFYDKFSAELGTNDSLALNQATTAIAKATEYLSDWKGSTSEFDFESLVEDDELEMAQTINAGIQSQLSIAQSYIGNLTSKVGIGSNYLQTVSARISKINQKISKDNNVYQWLLGQLTYVKEKYMAKFGS